MDANLYISFRFLGDLPEFSGQGNDGQPEWPPSPLRMFQSLVAAAANCWSNFQSQYHVISAIQWFQQKDLPVVIAPVAIPGTPIRVAVPNNDMDTPASDWKRGREPRKQPNELKTMKTVCPLRLATSNGKSAIVYYLYPLAPHETPPLETLQTIARSVTHLGWGVDMAVGDTAICTEEEAAALPGERWLPTSADAGSVVLRTPVAGTLDELCLRHQAFLTRIARDERGKESFRPVPPLSVFRRVGYRRATEPPKQSVAAFSLLKPDASGFRAFHVARKGLTVAAMLRHTAKMAAKKTRPEDGQWIDSFISGHNEQPGEPHHPVGQERFAYLPLPSIEFRGEGRAMVVGPIRRVLVTVPAVGHRREVDWAGKVLTGMELMDEHSRQPQALLSRLPTNDRQIQRYLRYSSTWATVTPVVLPGYDDSRHYRRRLKNNTDAENQKRWLGNLHDRIDSLIRKAIGQAGYSDMLKEHAAIEWRAAGFWPGTDLVSRYGVPNHLKQFSRYHVRIEWRDANGHPVSIPGPICIGGGRFYGLGLFAALDD